MKNWFKRNIPTPFMQMWSAVFVIMIGVGYMFCLFLMPYIIKPEARVLLPELTEGMMAAMAAGFLILGSLIASMYHSGVRNYEKRSGAVL